MLMAYSGSEMMFCCHCGKPSEGGRFCAACGKPIAPDAVEAMAELRRHRKQMRLMGVALGLVLLVTAGLFVSRAIRAERAVGSLLFSGETSAPTPPADAQTPPAQTGTPNPFALQPPQQTPQLIVPGTSNPASRPSTSSIDPKAVENALTTLAPQGKPRDTSSQPPPASSVVSTEVASPGADRYPGSQPVEVKNADLPDIGIPVAGEVYSTTDSLATVISYYTQRYPDAEVMEISGQKIIAVNRPGMTKVIAIGTTGAETRIAIVQPH
jgi:hypothetical protein